jgi:hypothetical protein
MVLGQFIADVADPFPITLTTAGANHEQKKPAGEWLALRSEET